MNSESPFAPMFNFDILSRMEADNFSLKNITNRSLIYDTLQDMPISQIWEFQLGLFLVKYLLLTSIIIGTIGNGLSFAVLMRRRMRGNSVNFYLGCLACADTAVLYLSGFKTWLRVVSDVELLHVSGASCKIITFLFMTTLHLSAWLVVLVTADRFIVVWFPFKATTMCTRRRGRIASVIMLIVVVVYNLHLLWTMELFVVPPSFQMIQCAGAHGNSFMNGPYEMMKLISYSMIPFTLVLLMNIGIIIRICQHTRPPPDVTFRCENRLDKRILQNRQQLTMMLLVVSFSWLLLSTPFPLIAIFPVHTPDITARAKQFLAKTVCFMMMYLNHSINFFLYCIAGKKFRRELVLLSHDVLEHCRSLNRKEAISMASGRSRTRLKTKRSKLTREVEDDYV